MQKKYFYGKYNFFNNPRRFFKITSLFRYRHKHFMSVKYIHYMFMYHFLLKRVERRSKRFLFNTYYRNHKNGLIFFPSFIFKKQYFIYRTLFNDILKNNFIKGFFIYRNLFKISNFKMNKNMNSYNFHTYNVTSTVYSHLLTLLENKDFNNIVKIKNERYDLTTVSFEDVFSMNFNFHIHVLILNELYKSVIIIYLYNIYKIVVV